MTSRAFPSLRGPIHLALVATLLAAAPVAAEQAVGQIGVNAAIRNSVQMKAATEAQLHPAVMRGLGWSVAPKEGLTLTSINNGINRAREVFPRVYFNAKRTERLIECLKRYRWNISQKTGEAQSPLHDEYSHGADAFRYMALASDSLSNDEWGCKLNYPSMGMSS